MRNAPLVLSVAWGKNRRGSAPLDTPRGDKIPLDPQENKEPLYLYVTAMEREQAKTDWKREKPRRNEAFNKGKQ